MLLVDLLVAVPLLGALLAAFSGRAARWTALFFASATCALVSGSVGLGVFSGETVHGVLGIDEALRPWALTLDGISAPLVALTAFLGVIAVLASWKVEERPAAHHALLLFLVGAVMGVFVADHVFLFYVFWEAVLIPMYFLIGLWGHENRKHAAAKFFIYTFAGSVLMLAGIMIAMYAADTTSMTDLYAASATVPAVVYWLLLAGMLVKIPAVPLHTWLPDAHVEAPTAGSIMLAGVLLKMGGYGLIRLAIPVAPGAWLDSRWLLAALGVLGIVYGAAMALVQTDLKRLVAYSSVSHMGFVLLALSTGTAAGMQAAMLVMVSHGVVAGLLFLLVGQLYERAHTRELSRFGGLGKTVPAWATAFTFAALASLGLPGLSGFPGELLATLEAFASWEWWIAPASVGLVLAAAYNLRAVRETAHGQIAEEWDGMRDLGLVDGLPVALLAFAVVALGVWPGIVTAAGSVPFAAMASFLTTGVTP